MEGDYLRLSAHLFHRMSIHTLRMEGDFGSKLPIIRDMLFQSTPSAWRVTDAVAEAPVRVHISIHTLRMEGDSKFA